MYRRDSLGMLVPQNHRPPGTDVVDVSVAIDVVKIRPCGALEHNRLAADAAERPRRTIDTAGHELPGPLKKLVACLAVHRRDWHYNDAHYSALRCFSIGRAYHVGSP